MIKLGCKVQDKVTGHIGIVTGRCEYLNGCIQYSVTGKMGKDGKVPSPWIDENQLVVLGPGISVQKKTTGGPQSNAPATTYGG